LKPPTIEDLQRDVAIAEVALAKAEADLLESVRRNGATPAEIIALRDVLRASRGRAALVGDGTVH